MHDCPEPYMVQGSPSPIEEGGDNLLLLQEIFIPPVFSVYQDQPLDGGVLPKVISPLPLGLPARSRFGEGRGEGQGEG